jgi:hypothetical protein
MAVVDVGPADHGRQQTPINIGHVRGGRGGRAFQTKFLLGRFLPVGHPLGGLRGVFSIYNITFSKDTTSTTDRANIHGGQTMSAVKTQHGHRGQVAISADGLEFCLLMRGQQQKRKDRTWP